MPTFHRCKRKPPSWSRPGWNSSSGSLGSRTGGAACSAQHEVTGRQWLGFMGFNRVFPGFPICLEARPLYRLVQHSTCSQTALFRNFRRYVPYEQYQEILESTAERAGRRPVGLLYRWQGIKHGLVLHNGDFPTTDFKQTLPWGKGHLTVEHFGRFVRTLAAGKLTLESLRSPERDSSALRETVQVPTLWGLARLVTDGAELRLLALLVEILHHLPLDQSQQYITRREGERWIAMPQDRLAELLRVSVRTVQRAVADLKGKGLIETGRNNYLENEMRLSPEVFA